MSDRDLREAAWSLEDDGWQVDYDQPHRVGFFNARPPDGDDWIRFAHTDGDYPMTPEGVYEALEDYRE